MGVIIADKLFQLRPCISPLNHNLLPNLCAREPYRLIRAVAVNGIKRPHKTQTSCRFVLEGDNGNKVNILAKKN